MPTCLISCTEKETNLNFTPTNPIFFKHLRPFQFFPTTDFTKIFQYPLVNLISWSIYSIASVFFMLLPSERSETTSFIHFQALFFECAHYLVDPLFCLLNDGLVISLIDFYYLWSTVEFWLCLIHGNLLIPILKGVADPTLMSRLIKFGRK